MDLTEGQYTHERFVATLSGFNGDPNDDDDDEAFDDELADLNDLHEIQTSNDHAKPNAEDDDHLPDDDLQ